MAWIESHQSLANHPKTRKLARLLGVSRAAAIGHLQMLWWWAMEYAEDGDLARFDPIDIAIGCDWEGDERQLLDALTQAGFLDAGGGIHDWDEYAGRLIEKRRADAARKRQARSRPDDSHPPENADRPADVHRTGDGNPKDGARNRTVPYRTVPNQPETTTAVVAAPARGDGPVRAVPKPKRTAIRSAEEWEPNEGHRAIAAELGLDFGREVALFRDYVPNRKEPYRDLDAGFRTFLRRAPDFRPVAANGHAPPAFAAWTEVRSVLAFEAEHGRWPDEKPSDPALLAAVEAIGGWRQIQDNDIHRGQFTRAYSEFARARA